MHADRNINLGNFLNKNKWIISTIIISIATGLIIATNQWIYLGIFIFPLIILIAHEKSFIFPFGFYVFLLPFDSILTISGSSQGTTITKLIGIITILVLAFKGVYEDKLKRPDRAVILLMLFVMYGVLSFFWSPSPAISPTFISLFIFYLITSSYKICEREFNTLKWFIVSGGLFAALYLIYLYFSGDFNASNIRVTMKAGADQADDQNRFAFTLIIPVLICGHLIINQKKNALKILFSIILPILLFAIIITGSRGASFAIGIGLILFILYSKQKFSIGIILTIIAIIIAPFIPDLFFERWQEASETGGAGRIDIWIIAWHAFKEYFLFGIGYGNFQTAFNEFGYHVSYVRENFVAHNVYVGISVELGIIGISLFCMAIKAHYKVINSRMNRWNNDAVMLKAAFWAILSGSLFLDTLHIKSFWLLWMMIMMQNNIIDRPQEIVA